MVIWVISQILMKIILPRKKPSLDLTYLKQFAYTVLIINTYTWLGTNFESTSLPSAYKVVILN